jgi:hypothetical protein
MVVGRSLLASMLVGCWTTTSPTPPSSSRAWEPKVDAACIARGEQGTLLAELPDQVAGFAVTRTRSGHGVHLHRAGRELPDREASALWQALEGEWFAGGGLSSGNQGIDGTHACDDVTPGGCFHVSAWICQRSLDAIAARFVDVAAAHGAGDAAASIEIEYLENRGPRCQPTQACVPQPHYSHREVYDPERPREDLHDGAGTCRGDGDCSASQTCQAWYLTGGFETAEYRFYPEPRFCGCIAHRCTWFEQRTTWPRSVDR